MQVDTNLLIYVLFALLGVGWKSLSGWMKQVSREIQLFKQQPMICMDRFLSREDYEQGKQHVWEKLKEHEERLRILEQVQSCDSKRLLASTRNTSF